MSYANVRGIGYLFNREALLTTRESLTCSGALQSYTLAVHKVPAHKNQEMFIKIFIIISNNIKPLPNITIVLRAIQFNYKNTQACFGKFH